MRPEECSIDDICLVSLLILEEWTQWTQSHKLEYLR